MTHANEVNILSPVGTVFAVGGGVIAQAVPNTGVGAAGLVMALSGLLMAGFQYFKVWVDSQQRDKVIAEQAEKIAKLETSIQTTRENRHREAGRVQGILNELEAKLEAERLRTARLEGQLGITDRTHVVAINTNAEAIRTVANQMKPPVDVEVPHIEPLVDDDDTDDFLPALPTPGPQS